MMDMRNNKWRNVLTHARVNFSQSETSSFLREGDLNFELLLWGRINRKDASWRLNLEFGWFVDSCCGFQGNAGYF